MPLTPNSSALLSSQTEEMIDRVTQVHNPRYSRGGPYGEGFVGVEKVKGAFNQYHPSTPEELSGNLDDEIQARMRVKVSESFAKHAILGQQGAKQPNPIWEIVLPQDGEVTSRLETDEVDPSNQKRFIRIPGMIHKYEMVLIYESINCSSHCRYCYRLDLFNGESGKERADVREVAEYIKVFNNLVDEFRKSKGVIKNGLWVDQETEEPLVNIREVLFSGGDPMTLPNATIARHMALMADAGVGAIRIGTKELSFNPERFDQHFFAMVDEFHKIYPKVKIKIVGHYTHPFELIVPKLDANGNYDYTIDSYRQPQIRENIEEVLTNFRIRNMTHWNQFPLIAGINDSEEILRLQFYICIKLGIPIHNVYACREIPGSQHFRKENDVSRQYKLVENAKLGLSGLENHARLVMSTEWGKTEVVGVSGTNVILRINRHINTNKPTDSIVIVDSRRLDHAFYWLTKEVIDEAVIVGKETLEKIDEESGLTRTLKEEAARRVSQHRQLFITKPETKAKSLTYIHHNGTKETLEILPEDTSVSQVLSRNGKVEAACGHQSSCATCVASVRALDTQLPDPSPEEQDIVNCMGQNPAYRLTCQIPVTVGTLEVTEVLF